jgi:hypothetical protein
VTIRDREVLETLREDPELLAIADAVVETQRLRRRVPVRALAAVALAAVALLLLVLASPWDRGEPSVLDRALAAIETDGPVVHMTVRFQEARSRRFSPVTTETFYDKQRALVRVISRSSGEALADYTTRASDDEFAPFPGLLDGAQHYREALSTGRAKVVGKGNWEGWSVYWLRLEGGGRAGLLEVGIDRESYRPVVFRALRPNGTRAGFQVAVLGFGYVSSAAAAFQPHAPILVRGTVIGQDCRPILARVGASLVPSPGIPSSRLSPEIASARSGQDGRFVMRADPAKSPFRNDGRFVFTLNAQGQDPTMGFAFVRFSRVAKGGNWLPGDPVKVRVSSDPAPRC